MTCRHGEVSEPLNPLDPDLALVNADMTAYLLMDQLSECECGHMQQDHNDDDLCQECNCTLYREGRLNS